MCSCSQTTVYVAVCVIGSAVYDSASSSAAVRSVRGSPAGQEHRTGLHTLRRPLTKLANLRLAPRHSAAPVRTAAVEKHEVTTVISHVNANVYVMIQRMWSLNNNVIN